MNFNCLTNYSVKMQWAKKRWSPCEKTCEYCPA